MIGRHAASQGPPSGSLLLSLLVCLVATLPPARAARADCFGFGPPTVPNVSWFLKDSVAACPAGDSLIGNPHPSRLRISVYYEDANCNPRVGVPPESIGVHIVSYTGNLKANDQGSDIAAADSTDGSGFARITMPSFSGCGTVRLRLIVSGTTGYGDKIAKVRSTDSDADGRTTTPELFTYCDLNYDGITDIHDSQLAIPHVDHWHRNALFGTLVRRTNFCGGPPCQGNTGFIGFSQVFWSPNGRWITLTARRPDLVQECKVYIVPSDPADGNAIRQVTFSTPSDSADYDPSWSPFGKEITFGRKDNTIYRMGVPGFSSDVTPHLVTFHDDGSLEHRGDLNGNVSPDGQWVVFSRRTNANGPFEIFKIPINGDATKLVKLTSHATGLDYYPNWSPDGQYVIFQRSADADTAYSLFRVREDGTGEQAFYDHGTGEPYGYDATTASYSPDGRIVLAGVGPNTTQDSIVTHTIDPTLTTKKPIKSFNYADTAFALPGNFPTLSPRLSPDGTRLALGASQLWAVRRNMSLPPRITQLGAQSVVDSTTSVNISADRGLQTTVQVLSTDPEGDPITCSACFLQDGMTFNPSNCTLTWTPTLPVGTKVYVKFQVTTNTWPKESGGSDQLIAVFTVVSPGPQLAPASVAAVKPADGPNPTGGSFAITSPKIPGAPATLTVTDVAGRRVALLRGTSGTQLIWDGKDRNGLLAKPGIYLFRLETGRYRREGKVVVFR